MSTRQSKYQVIIVRDRAGKFIAQQVRERRSYKGGLLIGADAKTVAKTGQTRMAELERRWKKSLNTDTHALLGMLVFHRPLLRPVLFEALWERLTQPIPQDRPPYHKTRWFLVKQELALDSKLKVREACGRVSQRLAETPARGGASTIERSFYRVEPRARRRR